jgi:CheY-like chemotaxis protein/pSer/pThr/pTyr-binding forkhead associated (FHA) protein
MPGVAERGPARATASERDLEGARASDKGTVPRILCVDDEPAMLSIVRRALIAQFEIVTFDDPVAALALLEHGDRFSVVISDMRMPQMDGADFLARVRAIDPSSTRLALTACLERELPLDAVFGILTKPCPLNLLLESVNAAVLEHALHARRKSESATSPDALFELWEPPALVGVRAEEKRTGPAVRAETGASADPARLSLRLLGKDTELGPRAILVGKSVSCEIVIDDPRIAGRHARFFNSWRGVTLQDLSGTGSVRLNGEVLRDVRHVNAGDRIAFGPFEGDVRRSTAVAASAAIGSGIRAGMSSDLAGEEVDSPAFAFRRGA